MNISSDHDSAAVGIGIDGYSFEKVLSFTYLGSELNDEKKQINKVNRRIMTANILLI